MKRQFLILLGLVLLLISCNKNIYIADEDLYVTGDTLNNATVLGRGMDCGNLFLIKFDDDVYLLPINTSDNIFYGINLPEKYKIKGMRIKVGFREPFNDEMKFDCQKFIFEIIKEHENNVKKKMMQKKKNKKVKKNVNQP